MIMSTWNMMSASWWLDPDFYERRIIEANRIQRESTILDIDYGAHSGHVWRDRLREEHSTVTVTVRVCDDL